MKQKAYEKSHPWISFRFDLGTLGYETWLLLGEAQSKCEHIAGVPLRPDVARTLHTIYLAKGAHGTTAIEGNTLTEEQVRLQIEGKLHLPQSKEYLGIEVNNIVEAVNKIVGDCLNGQNEFSPRSLCEFNRQVLQDLSVEDDVVPGQLRNYSVGVMDYRGAPAQDCPFLLERLCDWLDQPVFVRGDKDGNKIVFAVLRAILAHLYIAWVHPFGDGNGRTARLVEVQMLTMAGVPTPAVHLLSNFYNETRSEYYRQLSYARESGGDVTRFIAYAVRGFVDGLREQLGVIREQQWLIAWRDFVFRSFDGKKGAIHERRRRVALALPSEGEGVAPSRVPLLTPEIAQGYANKSAMAVVRDLNALKKMRLVRQTSQGYLANRELILSFLPSRFDETGVTSKDEDDEE